MMVPVDFGRGEFDLGCMLNLVTINMKNWLRLPRC